MEERATTDPDLGPLLGLCALADRVTLRRESLQREVAQGYTLALAGLKKTRPGPDPRPSIPGGMLEALCIAGELDRPTAALDHHYTRAMPAQLAQQLRADGPAGSQDHAYARLFSAKLELRRMPRLAAGLEALFSKVAAAGLACARTLGAATPALLLTERPTLGELYASAHFGRSMPMLYAYPGDLAALPAGDLTPWLDLRYAGPLLHELSHLQVLDSQLVPAPGNLHEALAAWLGSEAMPEQMVPRPPHSADDPGGLDALPGGPWFAAVGAWVARACGTEGAIRAQAGAADLRDLLGPECAEALRLFGWLGHLDTSAPHLLADTFEAGRWWKLIDLHRDPALAREFHRQHVAPLLAAAPPPLSDNSNTLAVRWARALDALPWQELPAWHDQPGQHDHALAARAIAALGVRSERVGRSFRAARRAPPPFPRQEALSSSGDGPLSLDVRACLLRSGHTGPDAVGSPPHHPFPPALAAALARTGVEEWRIG